jgi:hypothetical protein
VWLGLPRAYRRLAVEIVSPVRQLVVRPRSCLSIKVHEHEGGTHSGSEGASYLASRCRHCLDSGESLSSFSSGMEVMLQESTFGHVRQEMVATLSYDWTSPSIILTRASLRRSDDLQYMAPTFLPALIVMHAYTITYPTNSQPKVSRRGVLSISVPCHYFEPSRCPPD